jgi:hypothetical protein
VIPVGNDVVDLADPESRVDALHPRWVERVFAPSEIDALEACRSPRARLRLHWALWAAKESAFKAQRRGDPGAVFSPRALSVDLAPLPEGDGRVVGRVGHDGRTFALDVRLGGSWVHAVAVAPGDSAGMLRGVARREGEPGRGARALAATRIGAALGLAPHDLPVEGCVSLSHHGRFVAFAFAPARA